MIEKRAEQDGQHSIALYSPCGAYRYGLQRIWSDGPELLYIMLNPSTATEEKNDATIERCQRRAKLLGFGAVRIANLFAYRATHPKDLRQAEDPEGPENAALLSRWSGAAGMTIAGWGTHGAFLGQGVGIAPYLEGDVRHLGLTKEGHPRHPLYVSYSMMPQVWPKEDRYVQRP
ncbi:DUF1643 domain-containing protein [Pelagimonas varians]|uniref:DUF1643 domain-containing protein n=1 Tax=Pelagimonas varians TaxID=696760 RepID=A0A238K5H3_9RHOB|nr:DUF1643 domain-containing protein [Pelagimonas varians]PYG30538.1 hypothetical protein C8N36_106247 [Pelagimonas varians]SMX37352.1 hypothetical protein PEV8663_01043 [Pelagimonas varians]